MIAAVDHVPLRASYVLGDPGTCEVALDQRVCVAVDDENGSRDRMCALRDVQRCNELSSLVNSAGAHGKQALNQRWQILEWRRLH